MVKYVNSGRSFDPQWPNETARCDLNLWKWRELVVSCGIEGDTEEVLHDLEHGFHQGIPDHLLGSRRLYTPRNHESAKDAAEKIKNTLAKEKVSARIFDPFSHEEVFTKLGFFRSSPMGSVVNGDGSFRVINNMSYPHNNEHIPSVNNFVDKK